MSVTGDPTLQLTILRHGESIVVDFASRGTLIPRSEVRISDAFLSDITGALGSAFRTAAAEQALAKIGGIVFSQLLSEPVRQLLRETAADDLYLRLDEQLIHVPWELCHDGERFLFERFRVGRQVITGRRIPKAVREFADRDRLRVLVIADPAEDLPQAVLEGERLCALLDEVPRLDVTLLAGKGARRLALLAALQEHEVVHFAGHSHFDAEVPSRSGWRLADGVLDADELTKLRPAPLLIFSNSCAAAATAPWQIEGGYDRSAYGLGSAFLLAGVSAYVGTFWPVYDEESLTCAMGFYRALARGAGLGEALAAGRQAVLSAHGAGFTWASYLLYGDPAARPLGLPKQGKTPAVVAPATPHREVRYAVSISGRDTALAVDLVGESRYFVGRDAELERLLSSFTSVVETGERSTVFLSGPPGIGKTTLLDAFIARVTGRDEAWVAFGQAVEQYGAGEAYLPLLEALGRLGAGPAARFVVEQMRRHAPTWLAQLPALTDPSEQEALARRALGSTRDRMLRELADLLEALTAERALVLVVEDLHWSDLSTTEAIAYIAQRRTPARLLVVGTYRPAEVLAGEHPLRAVTQELEARRRSVAIRLDLLSIRDVARYLEMRFEVGSVAPELVDVLHRRTEGHPLFLVNVVDFAQREKLIAIRGNCLELSGDGEALAASIPQGLLSMIERQIEVLTPADQQVLEAAAAAGAEFATASVASALDTSVDAVEERCEALAWRGQMLRSVGIEEWPDGTRSGRYRFMHALYQNVLHERIAEPRRLRLHRRIADAKARGYGTRVAEIAAELAAHCEAAHESRRAVEYRVLAGDVAVRRHAEQEAVDHYRAALDLLGSIDDRAEDPREMEVLMKLATRLLSTAGYAAVELEAIFERAYALSRRLPPGPHRAPLLRTLESFHHVRGRLETGREVGTELLDLCERGEEDSIALVQALYGLGTTCYDLAQLERAQVLLTRALEKYEASTHEVHVARYGGYDPGVACICWLGWLRWMHGEPERALSMAHEGRKLAERLGHPFSTAFACMALSLLLLQRRDLAAVKEPLERALAIANEDGFPFLRAATAGLAGWTQLLEGNPAAAITSCEDALAAQRATGAGLSVPAYMMVLAYAYAFRGDRSTALARLDVGVAEVERTGQRLHLPGLWRARGEILALYGNPDAAEVEDCHRHALEVARSIDAVMLELQAATGLGRALHAQGRQAEARILIEPIYARFHEGFETGPLVDARALLES